VRARCAHPTGAFEPFPRTALAQSIVARFEAQVRAHGDRRAIKTGRDDLTYAELDRLAGRIARGIAGLPAAVTTVALLLDHGAAVFAAMLGALKAATIYVPLDPAYPVGRLRYLLDDSGAGVIVTDGANRDLADALSDRRLPVVNVEALSDDGAVALARRHAADDVAFIVYTSGSTGQPKGVPQTHVNVVQDVFHYTNAARFCAADRFLLVASVSFADSVRTIYSALLNGAALYPFDLAREGVASLATWLRDEHITVYRSIPTVYRHFTATLSATDRFPDVRLIFLSGEPVTVRDLQPYRAHFSRDCIFVNRIGTAESLTFCCYFLDHDTVVTGPGVPVGYPVVDKDVVLLDETAEEATGARVGEIGVRSRYLTPGYWGKPELTRAAFVDEDGGGSLRTYRTGDIGRVLPDGCLVHLGRKDFQVKVRGHRIEIAEIELALLEHPAVGEAVVLAGASRRGDTRLVAYLTLRHPPAPTVTALRDFLVDRVPSYMIPAAFVVLDALPQTPTGKLDRRALPPPGRVRPALDAPYVAPATEVERAIAGIWADVLEVDEVGVHDRFLDLGGDSLLAGRVLSRLAALIGMDLPRRALLGAATAAEMAQVTLDHMLEGGGEPSAAEDQRPG
jgi:amino acid adenylation domain-containing protein